MGVKKKGGRVMGGRVAGVRMRFWDDRSGVEKVRMGCGSDFLEEKDMM